MPVLPNPFPAIILNPRVRIHLPEDKDLLAALLILEPDLVKSPAPHRTIRLDPAPRLVRRQLIRRHCVSVVHTADDDRSIRIPFEKDHDDFMANARDKYRTPFLPRPQRPHPQPARTVAVVLPCSVPVELHLHAPVLIGEDLLASRPHYYGRLRSRDYGLPRHHRRPVR